jgi:hypothetical protein
VTYLEHYLKASILHDEDSRQYVKAADNTTSTAPGMIPTPQSTQVINALANADRGMIDAISRETLVSEGMTFELPKVTAVPSVDPIAENTVPIDDQEEENSADNDDDDDSDDDSDEEKFKVRPLGRFLSLA